MLATQLAAIFGLFMPNPQYRNSEFNQVDSINQEISMKKDQKLFAQGFKVQTDLKSGYWTCTGVKGKHDKRGYYWNYPKAAVCYKPKYAPIVGAPVVLGGGEDG